MFTILLLRFNRGHWMTFFAGISCQSVPLQRSATSLYLLEKNTHFASILCCFGPRHPNFNTWDLNSSCKFYTDLLKFAGVIPENQILSNYIVCCLHAMHDSVQVCQKMWFHTRMWQNPPFLDPISTGKYLPEDRFDTRHHHLWTAVDHHHISIKAV